MLAIRNKEPPVAGKPRMPHSFAGAKAKGDHMNPCREECNLACEINSKKNERMPDTPFRFITEVAGE